MRREELEELHCIQPIANIASILDHGILSHTRASPIQHRSVAMEEIQERRRNVAIPGGWRLHEYANLYINARNKMLFRLCRTMNPDELCVLRVSLDVLDLPNVVIADCNASSDHVRFAPSPRGLSLIDRELVFAEYWTHPGNQILEWQHGSAMCAEVLAPDRVEPRYIQGAYVRSDEASRLLGEAAPLLPVEISRRMFFC